MIFLQKNESYMKMCNIIWIVPTSPSPLLLTHRLQRSWLQSAGSSSSRVPLSPPPPPLYQVQAASFNQQKQRLAVHFQSPYSIPPPLPTRPLNNNIPSDIQKRYQNHHHSSLPLIAPPPIPLSSFSPPPLLFFTYTLQLLRYSFGNGGMDYRSRDDNLTKKLHSYSGTIEPRKGWTLRLYHKRNYKQTNIPPSSSSSAYNNPSDARFVLFRECSRGDTSVGHLNIEKYLHKLTSSRPVLIDWYWDGDPRSSSLFRPPIRNKKINIGHCAAY